ncbi:MAG: hypothetical protein QNJ16_09330 [Rhodobacter sp.]|nr:hypothetical protein [Rhodobacter sp.]
MQKSGRILAALPIILLFAGCSKQIDISATDETAIAAVARATPGGRFSLTATANYQQLVEYGNALTAEYLKKAENTSAQQDIAFFSLLGLSLMATNRAIEGAQAIEQAKYAAGTIAANEVVNYIDPQSATQALLRAAVQLNCVVTHAVTFQDDLGQSSLAEQANLAMIATYELIKINLRKAMMRQLPDFSTIADNMRNAIEQKQQASGVLGEQALGIVAPTERLAEFKVELAKCPTKQ